MPNYDITQQYWHPMVNDEVGGWSVANYNTDATSKLSLVLGQKVVADCLSERIARLIATQHNAELDRHKGQAATRLFDTVEIRVTRGDKTLALQQAVAKHDPLFVTQLVINDVADTAIAKLREEFGD